MSRTRLRRYSLILGLLAMAGMLAFSWYLFRMRHPNFFDREQVDAGEVETLKGEALSQEKERTVDLQSWPQFRGPNRDGWSPGTNFNAHWTASPPKVLWKQQSPSPPISESLPSMPNNWVSPALQVITLPRMLPVPFRLSVPDRTRFSTSAPAPR